MSYDQRWDDIAENWLADCDVPAALVKKYAAKLAEELHDAAEQFVNDELPDLVRDAEAAARDAHIQRQIDEARGK